MYAMIKTKGEDQLWTVGFWSQQGAWHPLHDFTKKKEAMRMVNYLNGGDGGYPPVEGIE